MRSASWAAYHVRREMKFKLKPAAIEMSQWIHTSTRQVRCNSWIARLSTQMKRMVEIQRCIVYMPYKVSAYTAETE